VVPFLAGASSAADESWTVVALPDTQYYANGPERRYPRVVEQTDWIAGNVDAENIAFVTHLGDIVQDGWRSEEWDRMDDAISTLDGEVPYSTLPGNHDFQETGDRSSGLDSYVEHFGASRYDGYDWYGGTGPGDEEANAYQLYSAGGYDFLHLALEWEPRDETLDWAQDVVDQHDRPTIVSTHSYLTDGDKIDDNGDDEPGRTRFVEEDDGDGNDGQTVWEKLIKPNPQVFMVLNGHFHDGSGDSDGEYHQVSENADGQPVYEMLSNFQDRRNGGYGWLRLISFVPGGGEDAPDRIQIHTYTDYKEEFQTDSDSEFGFDLDFESRFAPSSESEPESEPLPDPTSDVWFQQGTDGYDGASDTYLSEANPDTSYASAEAVTVDASEPQGSGNDAQALVRFGDIVGDGDGQIPPGSTVDGATLEVETTNDGDGAAVHRMLTGWSDDDTWASLGDGVQADGNEATADPDTETGAVGEGVTAIDVTASVQAWVDGESNDGWAFLPLGTDGWDFSTAEGGTPPRLSVNYSEAEDVEGDVDGDGDLDGDDVELVQEDIAGKDVDIDRTAADVDGDGDVDIADVVEMNNTRGSQ
jgi:hypothetical protein